MRQKHLPDVARLSAIHRSGLLEADARDALDRLVRLACRALGVPVALVSLVEEHRQVFAGSKGLREPWASLRETPLSHSFCRHVVDGATPLVVGDSQADPRVCDNLAVIDLGVAAYLGVPLTTPDGIVIGSLCAIDHKPRTWSGDDLDVLRDLSASATDEIALRHELQRRIAAEDARQLVVDELNHRVRNLFALVHGLVRDLESDDPTVNAFQDALVKRIGALVEAHSVVFETTAPEGAFGEDADFGAIVEAVLKPIPGARRIRVQGEPVALSSRQALYAALLLHELGTNALKHGAIREPGGSVSLTWKRAGTEVHVDWIEYGGPPAAEPAESGFGTRLIRIVTAGSKRPDAGVTYEDGRLRGRFALRL